MAFDQFCYPLILEGVSNINQMKLKTCAYISFIGPTGLQHSQHSLTGAGRLLRLHLCLHVRRSVQRLQVHILRL